VVYCLFGVRQGLISGIRNEDSHFNGNYEASDLRNRLPQVAPVVLANVQVNNSVVNRKKDSESIEGIGFHVFKYLVLLVFLFLCAGLCVILRFCAHTPKAVLWSLGTVGYIIILSIWVWVFYVQVPQIQEEMKKFYETENMMPFEGSDSVSASAAPGHRPPI